MRYFIYLRGKCLNAPTVYRGRIIFLKENLKTDLQSLVARHDM